MNLNGNWIDLVIILVLMLFAYHALKVGLIVILADFASFFLSLLIALRLYPLVSGFLKTNFSLSLSVANALGFLLAAILAETVIGTIFNLILAKLPQKIWKSQILKYLAIVPAIGEGIIIIAFVLTLIFALPVSPSLKIEIDHSRIGSSLVKHTAGIESKLTEVFGGVIEESLTYFTVKPNSHESVSLTVNDFSLSVDSQAEQNMYTLVNQERAKAGVGQLSWDLNLVPVARNHAEDMWKRKYFSHYSPEGKDIGDRLQSSGIKYILAGENLALAPTLETAHTGLMNSEGHRANILEPKFAKIGIGVIDNGYYGKMFVQVFTN